MILNICANQDAREYLRTLPKKSVDLIFCSPPYWGLRLYDGAQKKIWGGDLNCEHPEWSKAGITPTKNVRQGSTETRKHPSLVENQKTFKPSTKLGRITSTEIAQGHVDPKNPEPWMVLTKKPNQSGGHSEKQLTNPGSFAVDYKERIIESYYCPDCGAWFGALGLEPTVNQYVKNLVEIFREVHRVLKPSGSFLVNIGDSHNGSGGAGGDYNDGGSKEGQPRYPGREDDKLKKKDLCLVPQRLAIALQEAGWYIRAPYYWEKESIMPNSPKDRFQIQTEYIWHLTKSPNYYWDQEAVKEIATIPKGTVAAKTSAERFEEFGVNATPPKGRVMTGYRLRRNVIHMNPGQHDWDYCAGCDTLWVGNKRRAIKVLAKAGEKDGKQDNVIDPKTGKPKAQYADFNERYHSKPKKKYTKRCPNCKTKEYLVKHFASFPLNLPSLFIKAATSAHGNCAKCGIPWKRVMEEKEDPKTTATRGISGKEQIEYNLDRVGLESGPGGQGSIYPQGGSVYRRIKKTIGWEANCKCDTDEVVPAVVLDPFLGSGTTALAAQKLSRNWVGCDLSENYCKVVAARVKHDRGYDLAKSGYVTRW